MNAIAVLSTASYIRSSPAMSIDVTDGGFATLGTQRKG